LLLLFAQVFFLFGASQLYAHEEVGVKLGATFQGSLVSSALDGRVEVFGQEASPLHIASPGRSIDIFLITMFVHALKGLPHVLPLFEPQDQNCCATIRHMPCLYP